MNVWSAVRDQCNAIESEFVMDVIAMDMRLSVRE